MSVAIRRMVASEAYSDRNETLRLLGFQSYSEYLRSRLWEIVRERALDVKGRTCKKCGRETKQTHHAVYTREVLTGEDVRGLIPVCGGCHKNGSIPRPRSKAMLVDGLKVRHLHDTNQWLTQKARRSKGREYWCGCGRRRKRNHEVCGACRRSAPRF